MIADDRELVEELLNHGGASKWEESFLMSIADKLDHGYPLTEREQEKLGEIEEKVLR